VQKGGLDSAGDALAPIVSFSEYTEFHKSTEFLDLLNNREPVEECSVLWSSLKIYLCFEIHFKSCLMELVVIPSNLLCR
jgi:hypothetical protein